MTLNTVLPEVFKELSFGRKDGVGGIWTLGRLSRSHAGVDMGDLNRLR